MCKCNSKVGIIVKNELLSSLVATMSVIFPFPILFYFQIQSWFIFAHKTFKNYVYPPLLLLFSFPVNRNHFYVLFLKGNIFQCLITWLDFEFKKERKNHVCFHVFIKFYLTVLKYLIYGCFLGHSQYHPEFPGSTSNFGPTEIQMI